VGLNPGLVRVKLFFLKNYCEKIIAQKLAWYLLITYIAPMSNIDRNKLKYQAPKIKQSNWSANMYAIEEENRILQQESKDKEEKRKNIRSIILQVVMIVVTLVVGYLFNLAISK
jgi:Na+/glutamate symporter|tara:strand:- start:337 stop:678 length:342 start_codon:yes stop_codon:yes gene_type:complete